jgi:phage/plasmid-associated DNA primase
MIDFLVISTRSTRRGTVEIYPKFIIKKSSDLMIRGGDFYAIWIEERGLWSMDEQDALQLIDHELDKYAEENRQKYDSNIKVMHMWDAESGMIDNWHRYCQKQMRDTFHMLDEKLIFSNTETNKKDYASKKLNYPLEPGDMSAYDRLMSVLYSEEERCKIEWAIGSIVSGASKKLQKFMVLYGSHGTGKSTVLTLFSCYLRVTTRYLMQRLLVLLVTHLLWKPLRVIHLSLFNMMVTYQRLRITLD